MNKCHSYTSKSQEAPKQATVYTATTNPSLLITTAQVKRCYDRRSRMKEKVSRNATHWSESEAAPLDTRHDCVLLQWLLWWVGTLTGGINNVLSPVRSLLCRLTMLHVLAQRVCTRGAVEWKQRTNGGSVQHVYAILSVAHCGALCCVQEQMRITSQHTFVWFHCRRRRCCCLLLVQCMGCHYL